MKFKVCHSEMKKALEIIRNSKALNKASDDEGSVILIKVQDESVNLLASNFGVWANAKIEKRTDSDDDQEVFEIEQEGEVFVEGNDFINMILQLPKNSDLIFEKEEKESDDGEKENILKLTCVEKNSKKKSRSCTFLITEPSFFENEPPEEEREECKLDNPVFLSDAVNSTEFVSSNDDKKQYLWGVNILVYGPDDIAACASDKVRITWYDRKGYNRDEEPLFNFTPIKSSLVAALKVLNPAEDLNIEIGERYTILRQNNQWHGIPNAIEGGDGENLPNWRVITQTMEDNCNHEVKIPRETLCEFVKAATSSSCGKYGIQIHFDLPDKKYWLSVNQTSGGAVLKSTYKIEESINDENIIKGEDLDDSITLALEGFKEIINKYRSEFLVFKLIDCTNAVQIIDEDANFRYITSVVV